MKVQGLKWSSQFSQHFCLSLPIVRIMFERNVKIQLKQHECTVIIYTITNCIDITHKDQHTDSISYQQNIANIRVINTEPQSVEKHYVNHVFLLNS